MYFFLNHIFLTEVQVLPFEDACVFVWVILLYISHSIAVLEVITSFDEVIRSFLQIIV